VARRTVMACWLSVGLWGAGCAQGYSSEPATNLVAPSDIPPPQALFMGDVCEPLGGRLPCICSNGFEMGLRACANEPDSPTKAAWSECLPCTQPPRVVVGMGALTAGAAGASGTGAGAGAGAAAVGGGAGRSSSGSSGMGAAGRAAAAGGGGGRAGAGGGTTAGPGRTRPTRTAPPTIGPGCECGQSCFPFGILACCLPEGGCGCTWAPGAYCL
jgi:hypothetical protein